MIIFYLTGLVSGGSAVSVATAAFWNPLNQGGTITYSPLNLGGSLTWRPVFTSLS